MRCCVGLVVECVCLCMCIVHVSMYVWMKLKSLGHSRSMHVKQYSARCGVMPTFRNYGRAVCLCVFMHFEVSHLPRRPVAVQLSLA